MNTRLLTILSLLALLGFSISAYAVKPVCPGDPRCKPDEGGGDEYYDVTITGKVGGGGDRWQYDGRGIELKGVNRHEDADGQLNLTYFNSEDLGLGGTASQCFGDNFAAVELYSAGISKRRRSDAHGKFWFLGTTYPVPGKDTLTVLYLLVVDGDFNFGPEGWPENEALMQMSDWELKVENQGAEIADRSCEGSGTVPDFMIVSVVPTATIPDP